MVYLDPPIPDAELPEELRHNVYATVATPRGKTIPAVDVAVAQIVHLLNGLPGVVTTSSCSGHGRFEASILFRAEDGDNDRVMGMGAIRELARAYANEELAEDCNLREVTRLITSDPTWDSFELTWWGVGNTLQERYETWCEARKRIEVLLAAESK